MNDQTIVEMMFKRGLKISTISHLTGLTRAQLEDVYPSVKGYVPGDEEILDSSRKLAAKIIAEAMVIMDRGMPTTKLTVMRSFLPVMARMIGQVQDEKDEETRAQLVELFESQKEIA